jgi:hypothetical protein
MVAVHGARWRSAEWCCCKWATINGTSETQNGGQRIHATADCVPPLAAAAERPTDQTGALDRWQHCLRDRRDAEARERRERDGRRRAARRRRRPRGSRGGRKRRSAGPRGPEAIAAEATAAEAPAAEARAAKARAAEARAVEARDAEARWTILEDLEGTVTWHEAGGFLPHAAISPKGTVAAMRADEQATEARAAEARAAGTRAAEARAAEARAAEWRAAEARAAARRRYQREEAYRLATQCASRRAPVARWRQQDEDTQVNDTSDSYVASDDDDDWTVTNGGSSGGSSGLSSIPEGDETDAWAFAPVRG